MMGLAPGARVWLRPGPTDFRKSINGLTGIVEGVMRHDPFSGHYFVFCNRTRTLLRILYWDRNGFCLWHKRLEQDRFRWPRNQGEARELSREEFAWLLRGLDIGQAHPARSYASAM